MSSDFRGSTNVDIKYYNALTSQPERKTFTISDSNCEAGREVHQLCVSKFLDVLKMGKEKCIYYGEDLELFNKEWIPSVLGVEFGVLVEGKTSIVCIGEEFHDHRVSVPKLSRKYSEEQKFVGLDFADNLGEEEELDDEEDQSGFNHSDILAEGDKEQERGY